MRFFKSIKFRLTVWYLLVITILLITFGTLAYFMLSYNLNQNLDDSLQARSLELRDSLVVEGDRISFNEQLSELVLLYDANGLLIQRFGPNVAFPDIDKLVKQALIGDKLFLTKSTDDEQEVRFYATPFNINSNRIAILVGRSTAVVKDVLGTYLNIMGYSALAMVILAGFGGFFLSHRALKPVDKITRAAIEIGEKNLKHRIAVKSEDELGRLGSTLNQMIDRLEGAFDRQRQFTADASHELRTPLAVIQAESTLSLTSERSSEDYRKSLENISQETTHMSSIIERLLFLARSDAGTEPLNLQEVDIQDLLRETFNEAEILGRDKGIEFHLGPIEDASVSGDRVKLKQLLINLLENAIKYTPTPGKITASIERKKKMIEVVIKDTGLGISSEHLPFIFQRFYRVDKARSRAVGGSGLGLAVAKSIVEAHHGNIEVESEINKGSIFKVRLPYLEGRRS
jgi:heavy metal sensor kinase